MIGVVMAAGNESYFSIARYSERHRVNDLLGNSDMRLVGFGVFFSQ
jgi:hypothetical protein